MTWTAREIQSHPEQRRLLWQWIVDKTGYPEFVGLAATLIQENGIAARDLRSLAAAVQKYAQDNIKFFREYPERWQSPSRTLQWGIGDCDDKSIFVASTLRSFRIPVRLVFLRMRTPDGRDVSHVYPQAWIDGQWFSLESVRPVPFGFDPARAAVERGFTLLGTEYIGDEGRNL